MRHSLGSGTKNSLTVNKEKLEFLLRVILFALMNCAALTPNSSQMSRVFFSRYVK